MQTELETAVTCWSQICAADLLPLEAGTAWCPQRGCLRQQAPPHPWQGLGYCSHGLTAQVQVSLTAVVRTRSAKLRGHPGTGQQSDKEASQTCLQDTILQASSAVSDPIARKQDSTTDTCPDPIPATHTTPRRPVLANHRRGAASTAPAGSVRRPGMSMSSKSRKRSAA